MATITKPMALDETLHTTESTPRRQADVLAGIQQAIREGFGQVASGIEYDNTTSGLTSDNVQGAIDEVKGDVDDVEEYAESIDANIASTQEVTGNPITLTDAAPINAEKLEVVMEPKQDLHGQSYPYVGGAGKNKFNIEDVSSSVWSVSGQTMSNILTDTKTSFSFSTYGYKNGTFVKAYAYDIISTTGNKTYTFEILENDDINQIYLKHNGSTRDFAIEYIPYTKKGYVTISFNVSGYDPQIVGGIVLSNIQLEEGQTATTFAPYTNICPISGYDSVSVDGTGVNVWDEEWELGALNTNTGELTSSTTYFRSKNPISVEPQTTYRFKMADVFGYCFYDKDGNFISGSSSGTLSQNITSPANAKILRFFCKGTTYGNNISINYPSTITDYVPYQSTTASVTFGQTVYGGKSDFVMGGTKKKYGYVDLGSLSYSMSECNTSGLYRAISTTALDNVKITSATSATANIICEIYKAESANYTKDAVVGIAIGSSGKVAIYDIRYNGSSDASALKTALDGVKLIYELATPTTIFTLPSPLKLLKGTNNISSNGTTINLGYQQNNVVGELKGEIEQAFNNHAMIYNIQSESTAVNMEYTDDYKAVVCEVPFVQEQHDYSTTPPTHWNIDLSACDIAVNGFACFYADSGGIFIENYKVMPTIESVRKDDGCFKVGIGFYNVKMTSAADNIDNFIISMDITAFGKVLDFRTL